MGRLLKLLLHITQPRALPLRDVPPTSIDDMFGNELGDDDYSTGCHIDVLSHRLQYGMVDGTGVLALSQGSVEESVQVSSEACICDSVCPCASFASRVAAGT